MQFDKCVCVLRSNLLFERQDLALVCYIREPPEGQHHLPFGGQLKLLAQGVRSSVISLLSASAH